MTIAETISLDHGYTAEIHYDTDAFNPMESDGQPLLILHEKAERHFGWTTDDGYADMLNEALDRSRHGKDHTLRAFCRWMRAYHDVVAILPVGAGEHSGTWTYLGSGASEFDGGGWDSGWVGFCLVTNRQLEEWGCPAGATEEEIIAPSFSEFAAWVEGSTYGYIVKGPDGEEIDDGSCWGFYGSQCMDTVDGKDGYMLEQIKRAANADWERVHAGRVAMYRQLVKK